MSIVSEIIREFYSDSPAEGVNIITSNNGSVYWGRARAVKLGTLIFLPDVKIEDLK